MKLDQTPEALGWTPVKDYSDLEASCKENIEIEYEFCPKDVGVHKIEI
jgi:hypothetical protein